MASHHPLVRRLTPWAAGLFLLIAWCAFRYASDYSTTAELRTLPAPERKQLFEETLTTLHTLCVSKAHLALTDHCREEAAFLRHFPECDHDCQQLSARFEATPAR